MKLAFYTVVLSFLLTACALSPQQVVISPQLKTVPSNWGQGHYLQVTAVDAREYQAIGTRGGIYKDSSVITAANNLPQALADAAAEHYRQQGYVVNSASDTYSTLSIIIEKLSYTTPDEKAGFEVHLECVLNAEMMHNGETYKGRYRVQNKKQYATVPGAEANERLLSEVVSACLQRLVDDPKLMAFTLR